ncbi:DUF4232 domain-containing protein [Streptomyces poonensis]|uniref:DUF4232 domain-containing protein n=1 Tax=Streptomyces poonensis TaxID=68255 RepID=UPI0022F3116F|nr:DUF4232 domain-containing protein [Streptomyces poonensis]
MNHGPDEQGPDGLEADELALRRLLHRAVMDIEPKDGTLEHLRRAVPARRTRRRQAVVGMAAAVLFAGTAVPALVHVSNSTGTSANTSAVGNSQEAQGGASQSVGEEGGSGSSGGSADSSEDTGRKDGGKDEKDEKKGTPGGGTGPSATASPDSMPVCTGGRLGGATATVNAPDAAGAVYGTFRVTNVSGTSCSVSGTGGVSSVAQGAADQSKLLVTAHVAGDAATGLPDPSLTVSQLVLQPGAAYEVKFAWVPTETCPVDGGGSGGGGGAGGGGGGTDPTPDPSPTDSVPDGGGTSAEATGTGTGTAPQLLRQDGVADGSVAVTHTAADGAPSVTATVSNACAGTVYWTGLLAGS